MASDNDPFAEPSVAINNAWCAMEPLIYSSLRELGLNARISPVDRFEHEGKLWAEGGYNLYLFGSNGSRSMSKTQAEALAQDLRDKALFPEEVSFVVLPVSDRPGTFAVGTKLRLEDLQYLVRVIGIFEVNAGLFDRLVETTLQSREDIARIRKEIDPEGKFDVVNHPRYSEFLRDVYSDDSIDVENIRLWHNGAISVEYRYSGDMNEDRGKPIVAQLYNALGLAVPANRRLHTPSGGSAGPTHPDTLSIYLTADVANAFAERALAGRSANLDGIIRPKPGNGKGSDEAAVTM